MKDTEIFFGPKMPWGELAYLVKVSYEIVTCGHEWDQGRDAEIISLEMFETDHTKPELMYNEKTIPDHFLNQIKEKLCQI